DALGRADDEIHGAGLAHPVFYMALFDGEDLLAVALPLPQVGIARLELEVDSLAARLRFGTGRFELDFAVDSPVIVGSFTKDLAGLRYDGRDVADQDSLATVTVDHGLGALVPFLRFLFRRARFERFLDLIAKGDALLAIGAADVGLAFGQSPPDRCVAFK